MKGFKKIIATLLSIVTVAALGACDKQSNGEEAGDDAYQNVVLCDFENWEDGFQLTRATSSFGRITLNTDADYVRYGSGSAKIEAQTVPFMYLPLMSELFGYNYEDFSHTDGISFSVYNANETQKKLKVGLISDIQSSSVYTRIAEVDMTLQPGWNDLVYNVDRGLVKLCGNVEQVKAVYFQFEKGEFGYINEIAAPVYYLDRIELLRTEESFGAYVLGFDQYEICDFERSWHRFMIQFDGDADIEIVNASEYGLTAPSGKRVLRVLYKGGGTGKWYNLTLEKSMIQASWLTKLTTEQAQKAYVCADIYNNYDGTKNSINNTLMFKFANGKTAKNFGPNQTKYGQWLHVEVPLADVLKENPNLLTEPGAIAFSIADGDKDTLREFFYDNLHIEVRI